MSENKKEKSNSSSLKSAIIVILSLVFIFIVARYTTDESFRSYIDINILRKEVSESSLSTIEIDPDSNPLVFAYDKYISVPLVESNGKYLVIAEKDDDKIYLISGSNILWEKSVDGNLIRVNVNQNGYVSAVMKNTIYRSVVMFYDLNGKELFRKYISTNYAICTAISNDNKYLAIGEVDYTGSIIKSYVSIISAELAQTDPDNSIIYVYESENDSIITNITYQDKNVAICMFDHYIQKVTLNSNERFYDFTNNDVFVDINLKNSVAVLNKQSSGLFSYEYEISLKNTDGKSENLYILNSGLPKSMVTSKDVVALNLGSEIQIVNSNGWLLKKYHPNKQITNIILGDSIAGVIYKNKIEIVDF